jgi:hypothetical protein
MTAARCVWAGGRVGPRGVLLARCGQLVWSTGAICIGCVFVCLCVYVCGWLCGCRAVGSPVGSRVRPHASSRPQNLWSAEGCLYVGHGPQHLAIVVCAGGDRVRDRRLHSGRAAGEDAEPGACGLPPSSNLPPAPPPMHPACASVAFERPNENIFTWTMAHCLAFPHGLHQMRSHLHQCSSTFTTSHFHPFHTPILHICSVQGQRVLRAADVL